MALDSKVSARWIVSAPEFLSTFPGIKAALGPVPVPIVTAPVIKPPTGKDACVDLHRAGASARSGVVVDNQFAALHGGDSRVSIRTSEGECAGSDLGERTGDAVDRAGKGRAQVVAAHGEVLRPEMNRTTSFDRPNRHARKVV